MGLFGHFFLSSIISLLFLPPFLWETVRYKVKYCLKGPFNPNQPKTLQETIICLFNMLLEREDDILVINRLVLADMLD